jgi:hypothetical protein
MFIVALLDTEACRNVTIDDVSDDLTAFVFGVEVPTKHGNHEV